MHTIERYGLSERFTQEAMLYPHLTIARVLSQGKDIVRIVTHEGALHATVSGKFRHGAQRAANYPAVGDFVMVDRATGAAGDGVIEHVLTRKSCFVRKAAGSEDAQVVAANIDVVFICMALGADFNLRRAERYLSIAWDSGATPVFVLTKADLCGGVPALVSELERVALGTEILVTTSVDKATCEQVARKLRGNKTGAFIGSSGVGKSTLINCLLGEDALSTGAVRADEKGRHTTTRREMIPLADGVVIDTPGMREVGIDSADFSKSFADIGELAQGCRFVDCTHENEPGCAVRRAIEAGLLDEARLESYRKLKKEARYEGLNSRQIETEKLSAMFADVGGMKNARKYIKAQDKRRQR